MEIPAPVSPCAYLARPRLWHRSPPKIRPRPTAIPRMTLPVSSIQRLSMAYFRKNAAPRMRAIAPILFSQLPPISVSRSVSARSLGGRGDGSVARGEA